MIHAELSIQGPWRSYDGSRYTYAAELTLRGDGHLMPDNRALEVLRALAPRTCAHRDWTLNDRDDAPSLSVRYFLASYASSE